MPLSEIFVNTAPPAARLFSRHGFRSASKCVKLKDNRMSSGLSIRPFQASDLKAILAIERASFGRDAYDRNLFADLARTCGGLFLVACRGNKVIGYSISSVRLN